MAITRARARARARARSAARAVPLAIGHRRQRRPQAPQVEALVAALAQQHRLLALRAAAALAGGVCGRAGHGRRKRGRCGRLRAHGRLRGRRGRARLVLDDGQHARERRLLRELELRVRPQPARGLHRRAPRQQLVDTVLCVLYFLVLLLTIIAAPTDELLYYSVRL